MSQAKEDVMKVLLAIDSCDSHVIHEVTNRPWPSGTLFCVMSVVDLRHWEGLPQLIDDAKYSAQTVAKCATEKLTKSALRAFAETMVGFPKVAIPAYAKEWSADLIMVGSHGHGALTRVVLGSVAQAVLRAAHCSVEIVRPALKSRAATQGMIILLATDGSECSARQSISSPINPGRPEVNYASLA
jgi:nucleotide-binding universal stress UspA family protein